MDSSVSLRVFGDDLDPDEITRLLDARPTAARRKGDVIPDTRYHRIASIGSWMLKTKLGKKTPLPGKIEDLIDKLTADLKVWADINKRFSVDIFCGVFLDEWNRGYELPHALVKKIADRGLRIGFDIYGPTTPGPLRKFEGKKSVRP